MKNIILAILLILGNKLYSLKNTTVINQQDIRIK
ncbi:hypothetical protein SAMN05421544_11453 [Riemerella columbipharyngis]|uniref:Uncharacterized protein n=1 Tax=Riemerella columbipharyngis TaxID=1071918 RepID=A0A1G7E858_9FLAO|nr:hypothetical protein SAMN05421544_11453 [Riemerella columbipharyngis]